MSAGPLSRVESVERELPGALAHRRAAMEKSLAASERALAMQEEALGRMGRSGVNSPLLAFAAGVGGATRTGSFGEALSNGIGGFAEANSREQRGELEKALRLAQIAKTRADLAATAGDIPLDGLMKSLEAISKVQTIRDAVAPVPSLPGFSPGGVTPVAQAATVAAPAPIQPTPPTPATPPTRSITAPPVTPAPAAPPPDPAPTPTPEPVNPFDAGFSVPMSGAAPSTTRSVAPQPASQPMGGHPVPAPAPQGSPQPPPQMVAQAQPQQQPPSPFAPTPAQARERAAQQPAPPPQARAPVPQSEAEFLRSIAVPPPGTGWHNAYLRILHAQQNPGLYLTPKNKAVLNEAQQAYQTYMQLPEVRGKVEAFKAQQQAQIAREQKAEDRAIASQSDRAKEVREDLKGFEGEAGKAASALANLQAFETLFSRPTAGTGPVMGRVSKALEWTPFGGGTQALESEGIKLWVAAVEPLKGALSNQEGARLAGAVPNTLTKPDEGKIMIDLAKAGHQRVLAKAKFAREYAERTGNLQGMEIAWGDFVQKERVLRNDGKNDFVDFSRVDAYRKYLPPARITSADDYAKLQVGDRWIDAQGNIREKKGR